MAEYLLFTPNPISTPGLLCLKTLAHFAVYIGGSRKGGGGEGTKTLPANTFIYINQENQIAILQIIFGAIKPPSHFGQILDQPVSYFPIK